MKRAKLIAFVVLALLVLALGTAFYFQNESTQVLLYLHLGLWTWRSSSPLPVPLVMLASFAAGLALMGLYTAVLLLRRPRRHAAPSHRSRDDFGRDDQVFDDDF